MPRLRATAAGAVGAAAEALFTLTEHGGLAFQGGSDRPSLRDAAEACLAGTPAIKAGRAVALSADGELLGVWAAMARRRGWESAAPAFAPFLALGLRQAQREAEVTASRGQVERAMREVATVYEIGQAMDKVEIDRLLEMITQKAAQVMEAHACSLMIRVSDTDELMIAASWGLSDAVVENTRIAFGEGIAGRVAATGQPLRLHSLADDPASRTCRPRRCPMSRRRSVCR